MKNYEEWSDTLPKKYDYFIVLIACIAIGLLALAATALTRLDPPPCPYGNVRSAEGPCIPIEP